jgi:iron complex transport system ATP-binding protein
MDGGHVGSSVLNGGPLIEGEGLSFRRGPRVILKDVTFNVRRGEFLCVTGPNGAGKTTLLLCLLRLVEAEGLLRLNGRPLSSYGRRELARWMSYVPQADGRAIPFTAEDFVLLGRYPLWGRFESSGEKDRAAVRQALERAGAAAFARRPVASLSGGERQKVFIAAALAQEAPLLLLDEPTTFLDPRHQSEMRGLLRSLHRDSGATLVMVTHDINLAALCGDRVLALREGSPAFFGPSAEFLTPAVLEDLYGVPFDVMEAASRRLAFHREPG